MFIKSKHLDHLAGGGGEIFFQISKRESKKIFFKRVKNVLLEIRKSGFMRNGSV